MKSRLLVIASGACLGLAGIGQTAFAGRDNDRDRDRDRDRGCSSSQDMDYDTESESEFEGGLLGLVGINNLLVGGNNIGVLGNLLCGADVLNDLNIAVLGDIEDDDDDDDGDGRGGDVECSDTQDMEFESDSESEHQGATIGLVDLNNVGVQGNNIGALGNALCGSNVANDANVAILGSIEDDDDDDGRGGDVDCTSSQDSDFESDSDSEFEGGLLSLLGVNNLLVQGNNIGVGGNAACGADILNGLNVALLGRL